MISTPNSGTSSPAQKRTKISETDYQPQHKTLTADSPLLPHGLDIMGYDFKVNEVKVVVDVFCLCILNNMIHVFLSFMHKNSHLQIVQFVYIAMVYMIYFILDMQKH